MGKAERIVRRVLAAFFIGVAIVVGGTKPEGVPTPRVTADTGLTVSASFGCETNVVDGVTNLTYNALDLRWTFAPPVLSTDTIYVAARQNGLTNAADWAEIHSGLVSDGTASIAIGNATNFHYYVYADYTVPDVVATNGVYHLNVARPEDDRFVPLRAAVFGVDGNGNLTNITEKAFKKEE